MTRLVWGAAGERFFETGVDRGVLFVGEAPGVPWNGLISVTESPSGGEAEGSFYEGYKYANRSSPEQYEATIEAFTYPDEFAVCDGTAALGAGLFATQQRRKPFTLVYRTLIGNDLTGLDKAYKLHFVYNALAAPSSRAYSSVNDSPSAANFSWKLTARPPRATGLKPTAHIILDSRKAPQSVLSQLEDALYGTSTSNSRKVSLDELLYLAYATSQNVYDAKTPTSPQYFTIDGGYYPEQQNEILDGGLP